jgi:hypothetical protein
MDLGTGRDTVDAAGVRGPLLRRRERRVMGGVAGEWLLLSATLCEECPRGSLV